MMNERAACPKCGSSMCYSEGEDEFSGSELRWYAVWQCDNCRHDIRDFEDEFEFPSEHPCIEVAPHALLNLWEKRW